MKNKERLEHLLAIQGKIEDYWSEHDLEHDEDLDEFIASIIQTFKEKLEEVEDSDEG